MDCPACGAPLPEEAKFCNDCGQRVSTPPPAPGTLSSGTFSGGETMVRSGDALPLHLSAGDTFAGRYAVERVVGRGGMGAVYRAQDTLTGAPVGLKVILPDLVARPDLAARFLREGALARDLRHRNIVGVYDVNQFEGTHFLTMEFLDGRSLREWLRECMSQEREISLDIAVGIVKELLAGLGAAHTSPKRVVHRDVKPENIMLLGEPLEGDFRVKILDFGIARAVDSGEHMTMAGSQMGTAVYMAPEQKTRAETAGPPADLYSVGVILYEMLMEVTPEGRWELPSVVRSELPKRLDEVCLKALNQHPKRRYATAAKMQKALDGVLEKPGEPAAPVVVEEEKKPVVAESGKPVRVQLVAAGPRKIAMIKAVRGLLDLSLKDGKELVEGAATAPQVLKARASPVEARIIRDEIEAAGGEVEFGEPRGGSPAPPPLPTRAEHRYAPEEEERFQALLRTPTWRSPTYPRNRAGMLITVHERTGLLFVLAPGGEFSMGGADPGAGSDEKPVHKVRVPAFLVCATACTQAGWEQGGGKNNSRWKDPRRPVEMVRWSDAREWCQRNSLRLPSEAEWEYAARAGTTTAYSFGGSDADLRLYGWFGGNSGATTHPVGELAANPWGLYDVHGNVWEWCEDIWHDGYELTETVQVKAGLFKRETREKILARAPRDGTPWVTGGNSKVRVYRGGAWGYSAKRCRSAFRSGDLPESRYYYLGFRPVVPLS